MRQLRLKNHNESNKQMLDTDQENTEVRVIEVKANTLNYIKIQGKLINLNQITYIKQGYDHLLFFCNSGELLKVKSNNLEKDFNKIASRIITVEF